MFISFCCSKLIVLLLSFWLLADVLLPLHVLLATVILVLQKKKDIRIRELTCFRTKYCTGCLKSEEGKKIRRKEGTVQRWTEHIHKLYDKDRLALMSNISGPPNLDMKLLNTWKTPGSDKMSVEVLCWIYSTDNNKTFEIAF